MKKIFLIFCLVFLFSCENEYTKFHEQKTKNTQIQKEISDFSFEKIESLSGLTLRETPDLKLLDDITQKIDSAQKRVYIEVYIFTEKRIKKALINAQKRGVDVKVLLEKNVYLAGNLNTQTFKDLQKNGIEVAYSNPKNYALNHSKMMIIDDSIMISTGNYSYSSFKYNREFFLFLENQKLFETFLAIFEADFAGIKKNISQNNLVLSPFSSRPKIEYLLKNATKSIQIYAHNFSDESITNILKDKKKNSVSVEMIFPDLKKVASNENELKDLQENNISIKILDKPEIHAKMILIDGKYLYIGSVNFSPSSMDKNREIWLLIKNPDVIAKIKEIFKADFVK